ncbi:MAG: succinylglutamate desuccinylase/aspartoacylase family protein, partial [Halobacteria archaeon]|nr:succinylglutamate desuccinylase/aspartoacylase family protein [Halobacteria archaeon]
SEGTNANVGRLARQESDIAYIQNWTASKVANNGAPFENIEFTPNQVMRSLMRTVEPSDVEGRILLFLVASPKSFRDNTRYPVFDGKVFLPSKPNRSFPHPYRSSEPSTSKEEMNRVLSRILCETSDYYLDLHSWSSESTPFVIRDVVYHESSEEEAEKATQLSETMGKMARASGFPTVLKRSVSGSETVPRPELERAELTYSTSMPLKRGIPSLTVELGGPSETERETVREYAEGVKNVLRHVGVLGTDREEVEKIRREPTEVHHRIRSVEAVEAGMTEPVLGIGDGFDEGDTICRLEDVFGDEVHEYVASNPGWLISYHRSMQAEKHQEIACVAEEAENPVTTVEITD